MKLFLNFYLQLKFILKQKFWLSVIIAVIIFCLHFIPVALFAQNEVDSILKSPALTTKLNVETWLNSYINEQYPLGGQMNNERIKLEQFVYQSSGIEQSVLYEYERDFFYGYSKGGYRFWQSGNPLFMGMQYSYNNAFGLNKLDVIVGIDAVLVNQYLLDETSNQLIYEGTKQLSWGVTLGAEYEIRPNLYGFVRTRSVFSGKKYIGQLNEGGVKMKF